MARCLLIAIALVCGLPLPAVSVDVTGAPEVRLGLEVGAGLGHMSYGSEFDRVKLGGGVSVDVPVGQVMGLRSGLYWRPNGSGLFSVFPEITSLALRLDYIALPVGITYALSGLPLLAYGALEPSYLVRAQLLVNDLNSGRSEADVTDQMNRWDIAPVLGLAVFTKHGFELALQHSWGLRSVYKESGDRKNRSLWLLGTLWIDFL
jgi:hypothetical protein